MSQNSSKKCSVEDCGNIIKARGYCDRHYGMFRKYGNAEHRVRAERGFGKRFLDTVAIHHTGDQCLAWPTRANSRGYGSFRYNGRTYIASRYVCEKAHGKPPVAAMEAAHTCGNRACVSPRHIRWATSLENNRDKILHGTLLVGEAAPGSRLSEMQAREIKYSSLSHAALAKRYGVSLGCIYHIKGGSTWAHL